MFKNISYDESQTKIKKILEETQKTSVHTQIILTDELIPEFIKFEDEIKEFKKTQEEMYNDIQTIKNNTKKLVELMVISLKHNSEFVNNNHLI